MTPGVIFVSAPELSSPSSPLDQHLNAILNRELIRMTRTTRFAAWLASLMLASLGAAAGAAGQVPAGAAARFNDLETWTKDVDDGRQVEQGLGLVVPSGNGPLLVSVSARMRKDVRLEPAREVTLQIARAVTANPNATPTFALRFRIDAGTDNAATLDFTTRATADSPIPGPPALSLVATLRPAEFVRLAGATTLRGAFFDGEADFRPDQIRALRDFADRAKLR
jgi:hypothetical protein